MEVRRDSPLYRSNVEKVKPVKGEELLAASVHEQQEGDQDYDPRSIRAKKKKTSFKPSSISMINKETDAKELVDKFSDKMAQSSFNYEQKEIQKSVKRNLDSKLAEFFKGNVNEKANDFATISASTASNKKDEINKQKRKQSKTSKDVDLKAVAGKVEGIQTQAVDSQIKKNKAQKEQSRQPMSELKKDSKIQETLKRYLASYSETLVKESPQKKKEAQMLRQKLLDDGFSLNKLKKLETGVRSLIHSDLKKRMKKSFIKYSLSYAPKKMSLDLLKNKKAYNDLARLGIVTGLFDKGEVEDVKGQAREDLKGFISEELDSTIAASKLKGESTKELVAAFDRFNALASVAKFDPNKYLAEFQKKLEHMGLAYFEDPNKKGVIDSDTESDSDKKGDQDSEQSLSGEEIEDIEDQLRALFMQKAIKGGMSFDIRIKIRKLKQTLKSNGNFNEDIMKKLKEEGESVAKLKFTDLLREAFEERASLPELRGPGFNLVKRKMKVALKGLKSLGHSILRAEAREIRDNVNKAMFSIIKEDYLRAEMQLENDPTCLSLQGFRNGLLTALERLKTESKIKEEIRPKMFGSRLQSNDTKIIEAA
jgi:hypothetical protein